MFAAELEAAAARSSIDPLLLTALVEHESGNDPHAWNPEPRYRYLWNVRTRAPFRRVTELELVSKFPPNDFPTLAGDPDQEWWAQQASWGLTQIMGAVAREHGYRGRYLTALVVDVAANLELGAEHLASQITWARREYVGLESGRQALATRAGLAAYNGGRGGNSPKGPLRNATYADRVLEIYRRIRKG